MARVRQKLCYADTRGELTEYKDARRGASEDEFWDTEELVDHRPFKAKKKARKRQGCPGNEDKSHVYVWLDFNVYHGYSKSSRYYNIFENYEVKVCCGCNKRAKSRSRRKK